MLSVAWRIARRELRGGLRGFRVFLACLAIGVAAIAAAGLTNAAVQAGLESDARALLGGDVRLRLIHRPAGEQQLAWLRQRARVVPTVSMRAMARADDGGRTLVEMKAVAEGYPLYGRLELAPADAEPFRRRDGLWGAAVEEGLLARLGLDLGDVVRVGEARFQIRAQIAREPDRVANAFTLGPRLMIHRDALAETGLVQPGSLIRYHYLLGLPAGTDADGFVAALNQAFPDAGWRVRTTRQAAPGLERFMDNITVFLTLVGLTALLVGGIGVANAVRAFIEGRVETIATLKCLGASSRLVFRVYLLQIGVLALLGVAIGLLVGLSLPPLAVWAAGDLLPVPVKPGLYPGPLLLAAAFGLLVALVFGLWPLARAGTVNAAALFRSPSAEMGGRPGARVLLGVAAAAAVLAALTVASAENRLVAAWFVLGAAASLAVFRATAVGVKRLARLGSARLAARRPRPALRLGLGGLHRPGAPTGSVVLSLGLGLTVLVAVALIEGNLSRQLEERMPEQAPTFFFLDIQNHQAETFDGVLAGVEGVREIQRQAMIRGRIVRLDGRPVAEVAVAPEARWAVRGDRGLTMRAEPPPNSRVVAGDWWPADYDGPPLVSLDAGLAEGFGVGIGDTVTINVLGRPITLTIANLREIDWASLSMNFALVLSPGALEGAPFTYIATVRTAPGAENAVERAVTDALPNVSAIRVAEALESVRRIMDAAALAIRAAAALALVAGVVVLAGAVAAGHRRRVYEAVVLKVIGATRAGVLRAFLVEYGLLGLATGVIAGGIGSVVAWAVLTFIMRAEWTFLPGVTAGTLAVSIAVVMTVGFAGTWRALGAKAAPLLRND